MESPDPLASASPGVEVGPNYRAHIDRVYGYLLHRLGGRTAVAEELTRSVFVASVRAPEFRGDADTVESHLLSEARRELIVFLDRAARKPDLVLGPPGFDAMTISRAEKTALQNLEQLSVEQRLVVMLRHIDGLPAGLVAEATAKSVKATQTVLATAANASGFDLTELAILDRAVAPDPAFADELENDLVGHAEGPATIRSADPIGPGLGGDARFGSNNTPRLALLILLAVVVVTVLVSTNGSDDTNASATSSSTSAPSPTVLSSTIPTTTTPPTSTTVPPTTTTDATDPTPGASTTTSPGADADQQAPRRSTDPAYLARGPLPARSLHQTIWTGAEMIVWGGIIDDADNDPLTDGAAFDPRRNTWRRLSPAPLEEQAPTSALWAGDQMIVVSPTATLAYRHWLDDWVRLGEGIQPGPTIWTGQSIVLANSDGISMFDQEAGTWTELPDPGIRLFRDENGDPQRMVDRFEFGLHMLAGDLYFVRGCGPNIWRWTGSAWSATGRPRLSDLTGPSNVLFCAWANQTAVIGDRLLVWSDDEHPSIIYDPQSDTWEQLAVPPLPATEGPAGGLTVDGQVLAINWDAALFDGDTNVWSSIALPGRVIDGRHIVWTGDELLAWTAEDTWRTSLTGDDS